MRMLSEVAALRRWMRVMRVRAAQRLLRGTSLGVTSVGAATEIEFLAGRLVQYVRVSGGLCDPRRIRAYREVIRRSEALLSRAQQLRREGRQTSAEDLV